MRQQELKFSLMCNDKAEMSVNSSYSGSGPAGSSKSQSFKNVESDVEAVDSLGSDNDDSIKSEDDDEVSGA